MCVNCLCNVATDGSFDLLNSPGAIAMIGEMLDHTQVTRGEEDGGHTCKGGREGGRERRCVRNNTISCTNPGLFHASGHTHTPATHTRNAQAFLSWDADEDDDDGGGGGRGARAHSSSSATSGSGRNAGGGAGGGAVVVAHQPPPPLAAMATVGMYAKDVYGRGRSNGVIACLLFACVLFFKKCSCFITSPLISSLLFTFVPPLPFVPSLSASFRPGMLLECNTPFHTVAALGRRCLEDIGDTSMVTSIRVNSTV
jgi:hypothetical protein